MSAQQLTLEVFVNQQRGENPPESLVKDYDRCQAIAVDTSEQCQHPAIAGMPYCAQHINWNDIDADIAE